MTQENVAKLPQKKAALSAGGGINAIVPQDMDQAFRLGSAICSANMAPKAYERSAEKITVGILHGLEVGLTPMAALQSIAVINGTPSIWGDGALALVENSGKLEDFEETIEGDGDDRMAICVASRKGRKTEIRRTFSVSDAKKAKLWGKQGPWSQYPDRMLQMRARSFALRDGFSDVLRGLSVAEEVRDMKDMGNLQDEGNGSYAAPPARPKQSDFEPSQADTVEMLTLIDEFGETIGEFSEQEFVTRVVEYLDVFQDRARLDAFMEFNEETVEALGTRTEGRQEIARAFNAARDRCPQHNQDQDAGEAPDHSPEPEIGWSAWCANISQNIGTAPDEDTINALLAKHKAALKELGAAHPKWRDEITNRMNARVAELSAQTPDQE